MISLNRNEIVKLKGKIQIPNINLNCEDLLNFDTIINLLIDFIIEDKLKNYE